MYMDTSVDVTTLEVDIGGLFISEEQELINDFSDKLTVNDTETTVVNYTNKYMQASQECKVYRYLNGNICLINEYKSSFYGKIIEGNPILVDKVLIIGQMTDSLYHVYVTY